MSADNCIAVLVTRDSHKIVEYESVPGCTIRSEVNQFDEPITAYRVAHAQAIDNFNYYEKNQIYMLGKYMHDVWGEAPIFYDIAEAKAYAEKLEHQTRWTEYGIVFIRAEKYSFT